MPPTDPETRDIRGWDDLLEASISDPIVRACLIVGASQDEVLYAIIDNLRKANASMKQSYMEHLDVCRGTYVHSA